MNEHPSSDSAPPISVSRFLEISGVSAVTLWRWTAQGRIRIQRIAGRKYITANAMAEFNRRLEAGEFAGNIQNPSRHAKAKRAV